MTAKINHKIPANQQNIFIQFFQYIYLSLKIMRIVAGGHGGTRNNPSSHE